MPAPLSGEGVQVNVKRLLLMSGACGSLVTTVSAALAQDVGEVAEVVIVTGSYIRGTPEDAALPVDVISSEELEKTGAPTTLELIKSLNVSNGVLGAVCSARARVRPVHRKRTRAYLQGGTDKTLRRRVNREPLP